MSNIPSARNLINHTDIILGNIVDSARQYLDASILDLLKKEGIAEDVLNNIQLADIFHVTFLEAPSTGGTGLRTTKRYTLRQLVLGEPSREAFIHIGGSMQIFKIVPSTANYPPDILSALEKVRDKLSDKFAEDLKQLTDSETFRIAFKKHNQAIISARIANYLLSNAGNVQRFPELTESAKNYFQKKAKSKLVKYKGKIVANMVALTGGGDISKALLVSTAGGKVEIFEWNFERVADHAAFKLFLKRHLPLFDHAVLEGDLFRRMTPWGRGNWRETRTNPLSYVEPSDHDADMQAAAMTHMASELNYLTYTAAEEQTQATLSYAQGALRILAVAAGLAAATASGPGAAVFGGLINVGLNIGDVALDYQLATNADRGEDYNKYMANVHFGIALGMLELVGDVGAVALALRSIKTTSALVPIQNQWKFQKAKFDLNHLTTPEIAESLVKTYQNITYDGPTTGFVYRGMVFRGDMRSPDVIFNQGFTLRTRIKNIDEVNGFRGGFGGGHDALDPDGMGISTSAFYKKDGAGAYYYGGHKGGHTYLIDARKHEGYHLYANRHLQEHPGDSNLSLAPWEINYGTDIPGSSIIGAFDQNGKFIANLARFQNGKYMEP
jgi:hypothetical protein